MKQITLNIEDSKFGTFMEFLKTLNYVKIEESESKALNELEQSLKQVKLMREGKIPKKSINELLVSCQVDYVC